MKKIRIPAAIVCGSLAALTGAQASTAAPLAPLATPQAKVVPGRYIVVFDSAQARNDASARIGKRGGKVNREFKHALKGLSTQLNADQLRDLRSQPGVKYVEPEVIVTASATQSPATWGLDRLDQRNLPLNSSYSYDRDGQGIKTYIVDTGVRSTHSEFAGRMVTGFSAINDGRGTTDCQGHGTHVAGTVAGTVYGVAKKASVVPVRVLDCNGSGTSTSVVSGLDWVTSNHQAGEAAVANMSLGGGASQAIDDAVSRAINDGVTTVVAAGNENTNACNSSPARLAAAITVGATQNNDARASYSNYGTCLDIFAPGSSITSAGISSDSSTATMSGTSMASPHVAGVAALELQAAPSSTPLQVRNNIVAKSTSGLVTGSGTGSPNSLLSTSTGTVPPPAPTDPIKNGSFENGASPWTSNNGSALKSGAANAAQGSYYAQIGGTGTGWGWGDQHASQAGVVVPTTGSATLKFALKVNTAETTTAVADTLKVQVVAGSTTTTRVTYSNLDKSTGYVQRSVDLSSFRGQTVTIKFQTSENWGAATSFQIDAVTML